MADDAALYFDILYSIIMIYLFLNELILYLCIYLFLCITLMNSLEYTYLRKCGFKSFKMYLLRKQKGERRYKGLF